MGHVLTLSATESLPSQSGQKGRPRKHGRVRVDFSCATLMAFGPSNAFHPLPETQGYKRLSRALIPQIAELFGVKPSEVTFYAHKSYALSMSFIVKGTDADTVRTYSLRLPD